VSLQDTNPSALRIRTGARLHFGMFSFGQAAVRQFGGIGVMVDRPALELEVCRAESFHCTGPLAKRVEAFARTVWQSLGCQGEPGLAIKVVNAPLTHVGLGTGTQLALAVARGISALCGYADPSLKELVRLTNRAQRSAVGSYGFQQGGLIAEAGKLPGESLAPLIARVAIPQQWRMLLITPHDRQGLSGAAEVDAFASLLPVPAETTDRLSRLAFLEMVPAAMESDFEQFSDSVCRYGKLAGECFTSIQGGAFANPQVAGLVETVRKLGVRGVGQSSWGPTVFAFLPDGDENRARDVVEAILSRYGDASLEFTLAAPLNEGAQLAPISATSR